MTLATLFWLVVVISLLFGGLALRGKEGASKVVLGVEGLLFVLIVIVGWQVFGAPIR